MEFLSFFVNFFLLSVMFLNPIQQYHNLIGGEAICHKLFRRIVEYGGGWGLGLVPSWGILKRKGKSMKLYKWKWQSCIYFITYLLNTWSHQHGILLALLKKNPNHTTFRDTLKNWVGVHVHECMEVSTQASGIQSEKSGSECFEFWCFQFHWSLRVFGCKKYSITYTVAPPAFNLAPCFQVWCMPLFYMGWQWGRSS